MSFYIKKPQKIFVVLLLMIFIGLNLNHSFASSTKVPQISTLYCNSDLLMDAESGNVMFEKNGYSKVYPASTTKVLTAILALENLKLDDNITVSKKAVDSIPVGSSVMGVEAGEVYSVENLLYGLLLPSGNDAAIVLSEAISGNTKDFAILMNKKAKEIGCLNSHFVNPHGFFDENHYTTAYDMAQIFRYALKFDEFRKICETKSIELPPTSKRESTKILKNTNRLIDEDYPIFYKYALGGKTGYTIESRGTYIGYAKKDDKLVIVASYDGSQNIKGQNARFLDAITLCNYGFDNFEKIKIIDKENYSYTITDNTLNKKYKIGIKDDSYALSTNTDYIISTPEIKLNFDSNSPNGTINFNVKSNELNATISKNICIIDEKNCINKVFFENHLVYIIILILIVILIFLIIKRKRLKV